MRLRGYWIYSLWISLKSIHIQIVMIYNVCWPITRRIKGGISVYLYLLIARIFIKSVELWIVILIGKTSLWFAIREIQSVRVLSINLIKLHSPTILILIPMGRLSILLIRKIITIIIRKALIVINQLMPWITIKQKTKIHKDPPSPNLPKNWHLSVRAATFQKYSFSDLIWEWVIKSSEDSQEYMR
jgi:hypothetical protein